LRACQKRPIGLDVIERVIAEIEYELQDYVMQVPSRVIGEKNAQEAAGPRPGRLHPFLRPSTANFLTWMHSFKNWIR